MDIVTKLFQELNYKKIEWESLLNFKLYAYDPDLIFENEDCLLIIELKSYLKNVVCAEIEASQVLKYATAVKSIKSRFKEYKRKRFLLITSGKMLPFADLYLDFENDVPLIEKRYLKLYKGIGRIKRQDDYESKSIYKKVKRKLEKRKKIFPPYLLKFLPVPSKDIKDKKSFNNFILDDQEFLVGFISGSHFQTILQQFDKQELKTLFQKLRTEPLDTYLKANFNKKKKEKTELIKMIGDILIWAKERKVDEKYLENINKIKSIVKYTPVLDLNKSLKNEINNELKGLDDFVFYFNFTNPELERIKDLINKIRVYFYMKVR